MITDKKSLLQYIEEDVAHHGGSKPSIKDFLVQNEWWFIYHLLFHLRHVEFYTNKKHINSLSKIIDKIFLFYHTLMYKRLSFKLHIIIYPNTCGAGLKICHCGDFTHVAEHCKIGKNCEILPGVVFGKKGGQLVKTMVGDNCYFGLGAKIIGSVTIGNNVTVGANAVVVKDIPDNAVVAGIPAKVIRINE